jgi:pyruvate dehydrogenase E2 component (dihydrolipoamide acetyltransferase)
MATDVRVPTTGNAGEEAVVAEWNVTEGSVVGPGDILVTLETAKATFEVEAPTGGQILKIFHAAGAEVPEHEVLAVIGDEGEHLDDGSSAGPAADEEDMGSTAPAYPTPAVNAMEHEASAEQVPEIPRKRLSVSPRARALAQRSGIDLNSVTGTGPLGRITISDVEAVSEGGAVGVQQQPRLAEAQQPSATPPTEPAADFTVVPLSRARKLTAERMHNSLQSTAQLTLTRYAKADAMLAYAARLREVTEASSRPRITLNDLLLFAGARTLASHPEANSWFGWEGIKQFTTVNLGFAVDTPEALLVPVIRSAERLTLSELSAAARTAIEKARSGKLTTADMDEGTFTVSNLGGLGVHWFTPVLNPPQSCILGVGATQQMHPKGASLLPLSLTFDHRAIDGGAAATVLADLTTAIETVDVLAAL